MYQVEKDTAEWGDKVSSETRERLDAAVERGRQALKGSDTAEINEARDELMQAFSAAGQEMYQAQAAEAAQESAAADEASAEPAAGDAEEDEDVVEADYEIVDEGR